MSDETSADWSGTREHMDITLSHVGRVRGIEAETEARHALSALEDSGIMDAFVSRLADSGRLLPDGGTQTVLYATFKDEATARLAPWVDPAFYLIRSDAEAALHTARVWGDEAFAARCVQTLWPDGREYRTPWEPVHD